MSKLGKMLGYNCTYISLKYSLPDASAFLIYSIVCCLRTPWCEVYEDYNTLNVELQLCFVHFFLQCLRLTDTMRRTQLERELESARASAHPTGIKDKEGELQRAKEEARRLGEERAKAQKVRPCCVLLDN